MSEPHTDLPLPTEHPLAGRESLIDELRACGRQFYERGWSVGTSSNYSIVLGREPVELIVTASGKDKGRLERTDFVHVGKDGRPIESDQPKSSAETMLHVVLADLENVGCILHTHSIWGTVLSQKYFPERGFEISGFEMLKGLEGITTHEHSEWVPVFDNTQDIAKLARQVEAFLKDDSQQTPHGFLIRQHGLYTWGSDSFTARRHIEIFEFLFECVARKLMLGQE